MTAHPPAHPDPVPETDSLRAAANRRIFTFVAVFTLLLAGALWLNLATAVGATVSTTHSIVGAVLGAGMAAAGADAFRPQPLEFLTR